ncbi:MAG: hypothetical protein AMXMBFR56_55570 [Polyangiaceae bacterium]
MSVPAIASRARADRISADENTIPDRRAAGPSGRPREMSKGTQALLAARDQALAQAKRLRAEQSTSVQAPDVRSDGQKRMDLFFSAANAAYRVDGHDVRVTPAFRMQGGYGPTSERAAAALKKALPRELIRELGPRLDVIANGKGTPEEIQRVTQALIDRGHLAAISGGSSRDRVRQLMFDFGIGLDCSGFAYQAHAAARGAPRKLGLQEGIPAPNKSKDLRKAGPGDLIVLGGSPGHKVAVYSHRALPAGAPPPSFPGRPAVPAGFLQGGPVHVFEVDSSWGAGGRAPLGGVAREIWLFNESTKTWGYFDGLRGGAFTESKKGAYDHTIVGLFGV